MTTLNQQSRRAVDLVSFIIPAWNEEAVLGRTLAALEAAARSLAVRHETIVVDDASTDRTAEIAREHGTRVLSVNHRQMARTRNAGAKAATGDLFIFVDADTTVTDTVVRGAVEAVRHGAAGGSCVILFDGHLPLYVKLLMPLFHTARRFFHFPAGCFLFCTRQAFEAVGGFSPELYAAEEVALGAALKRLGPFVVLREWAITSGRKLRAYSGWELLWLFCRLGSRGWHGVKKRRGLEIWYGERRPDPDL